MNRKICKNCNYYQSSNGIVYRCYNKESSNYFEEVDAEYTCNDFITNLIKYLGCCCCK